MTSIRYQHNYRRVTITPVGVVGGSPLTGNQIPAVLRNGQRHFAPYRGAMDIRFSGSFQRVKLVGLVAWTPNSDGFGGWHDIPPHQFVVGLYVRGGYYIALKKELPILLDMT